MVTDPFEFRPRIIRKPFDGGKKKSLSDQYIDAILARAIPTIPRGIKATD